jgi:general secretion pathway protein E
VRQAEIGPELKSQVREYLEKQGYGITEGAKLMGKSGVEHTFDMLAQRDDGFATHTIAICIATTEGDSDTEAGTVFSFANKAYDAGIQERIFIAIPELSQEAKELAEKQRIKVINEEQIESLLNLKPKLPDKPKEPFRFGTKEQLIESLSNRGYRVEEKAKVRGRSGVEYTFDILAYTDVDGVGHSLGIDFINGGKDASKEISLEQVALFDTKAYEVGIDDKIIVAPLQLSPEAQQFAQQQRIKVLEPDQKIAAEPKPTKEEPAPPEEKLAKAEEEKPTKAEEEKLTKAEEEKPTKAEEEKPTKAEEEKPTKAEEEKPTKAEEEKPTKAEEEKPTKAEEEKPTKAEEEKPTKAEEEKLAKAEKAKAAETKPKAKHLRHAIQTEALQLIPEVMARRYNAIPLSVSGNTLQVAMADPTDIFALEAFSALSRLRIKPIAANATEVREAIDFNYKGYGEIEKQLSRITISGDVSEEKLALTADTDAPLAQALSLIIEEAVKARSSDVHIEPEEDRLRVRYRIDGTLQDMMSLPLNIHLALVSRIKILADMNIADRHRAQDGQFSTEAKGREIDVRVATAPTVNGEMAELRLLDKSVATLGLSELGMLSDSLERYENMLKVPYGMILISGPTGAGKTTTLYASINSLDCLERNVITIEDPAEYRFKDINQIQVNPQAGITFATGLRSILRLDPDVIMVGEIRDAETANIAVQAALTGHLMLSSVHASDATGVLSRLLDLGVEPFLIASSVIGVVAQRMVRRICPDCSHIIEAPVIEQMAYEREIGEKKTEFQYGTGCKTCAYAGFLGRTGIFEILSMSDAVRTMLTSQASSSQIRAQALKEGMVTMMNDGMRKVKEGITTPSEVLRNAYSAD